MTTTITLDRDQQEVLAHERGPLTVLGGPGTGKTRVLEERFVDLATKDGSSPDRILFLVPNRAQKMDLQDRLTRRLLFDEGLEALIEVPVYTWHGLAHHLVTRHYDRLAYPEPPVLLTSPEQWGDVRDALANETEANWPHHRHLLKNRGFVDEVVDFCIRAEQRLLDNPQLDALAVARPAWGDVVRFFKAHRERLRARSRVDYPTLLADAAELIAQHEDVRDTLHERFLHILVDDGQELALVQQRLLHFLAGFDLGGRDERSLVLAGDPDSAIETFRGAEPDWIDNFDKEFGAHASVTLRTSYRLGAEVGTAALGLIARNGPRDHRFDRFEGETSLEVRRYANLAAEVESIARELRLAHLQDHIPYDEMAILLTSPRSMLPPLERALDSLEVPFSISAPDRPLVREPIVRAFADLAKFAFDDEPEPEKIVELLRSPLIELEDATVRELERDARYRGVTLTQVVEDPPDDLEGGDDARARIAELLDLRDLLVKKKNAPADEAFWVVWDRSRLCRDLQARARNGMDDPANRDLDALVAFSRALGRFVERRRGSGTFTEYLEAIGRADFGSDPWLPPERSGGGVKVVSFHGAKGKEWSIVAVAGVVEGSIPKGRRATGLFDPYYLDETDPVARSKKNEMEDRRVFYVAVTRASKRCIVTTSPGPTRRGEPSRFIEELTGAAPEVDAPADMPPLTFAEAAARYRKILADTSAPAPARVAALAAIARICELDPRCSPAQPSEWWWRWDWTEGAVSIREQQADDADDLPLDKLRTSYSRISTYDNCGLQYLLGVVLGLDPESSHNMAFGSVIHKVFEELETGALPVEPQAAYARYEELFDNINGQFPNKATARQFFREGQLMIERYGKYLKPGTAAVAEASFKVHLDGHRITGRIDRVDKIGSNVVISDYKTSKSMASWEEARESLQLAIYYLAATTPGSIKPPGPDLTTLGEPASMQLIYPNVPPARGDVQKRSQKPEEAREVLNRLPVLIDGVLAEDFRPDPQADCQWCKFKPLCPLWSEGKELPA
ncbi:MAG TPA: ATP-dependent DNA helicase [Actinomycetota bacterium]|nr:ATP-dependent DNA helicase [Actinomycetota bacterium]